MAVSTHIAVIAVGDRFRHDEGVGWVVLRRLRERAAFRPLPPGTVLAECNRDPGWLIRLWEHTELAIVLEPARGGAGGPGHVSRLEVADPAPRRPAATVPHGLGEPLELACELNRLPGHLVSYAVQVAHTAFGRGLTVPVAKAAGVLVERVEEDIARYRLGTA